MASLILNTNDMAYIGATPWHGLGNKLTVNATIDQWIKEANLNWSILEAPISFIIPDSGESVTVDGKKCLFRSDTHDQIAVVGDRFHVVQPAEVLEFQRNLVEYYGFSMETAGNINGGKKVWSLSKTGMNTTLKGGDRVENYLLVATANDGSMATTAMFTSVRVVCNNTLSAALRNASNAIRVRHSSKFVAGKVQQDLGIVTNAWSEFGDIIEAMSDYKVSRKETAEVLYDIFSTRKTGDITDESTRNKNIMREVMSYAVNSPGAHLESANGTAWGLLNAITYYADHKRNTRTQDARLDSAWFGQTAQLKDRAFDILAEKVGDHQRAVDHAQSLDCVELGLLK